MNDKNKPLRDLIKQTIKQAAIIHKQTGTTDPRKLFFNQPSAVSQVNARLPIKTAQAMWAAAKRLDMTPSKYARRAIEEKLARAAKAGRARWAKLKMNERAKTFEGGR